MNKTFIAFIAVLSLFSCDVMNLGKNYYISNNGDDSNTGHSEKHALKSLDKINSIELKPGDRILLNRGDIFKGSLIIKNSGNHNAEIYIGAYGDGENPVITGAATISDFSENAGVYTFKASDQVKNLYINDQIFFPARYPNNGFLRIDNEDKIAGKLYDKELLNDDGYWNGATVVYRSTDWTYDWLPTDSFADNTLYFDSLKVRYKASENFGYFIMDHQDQLDTVGEYYFNRNDSFCRFIPDKNFRAPGEVVYAVTNEYGIKLKDSVKFVKIENINFNKIHKSGIAGGYGNRNIEISNCGFSFIEQTAIRFPGKAWNLYIHGNRIKNVFGRGISVTNSNKCRITGNKLNHVGLMPGLGMHGVNGMSGIVVEARDETAHATLAIREYGSDSNYVALNRVDSCGYIGIRTDGKHNVVEKNVVNYPMMQLTDGAGIYCYVHTNGSTFRNNIVLNSRGNNESTPQEHHAIALGIYMDGSKNCILEKNTVAFCTEGMVLNANSQNHVVYDNVLFDNSGGQLTLPTKNELFDENHNIKRNVFLCNSEEQFCVSQLYRIKDFDFGIMDSNYYFSPFSENIIEQKWKVEDTLNLREWQKLSGQDSNSKTAFFKEQDGFKAELLINDKDEPTVKSLEGEYRDINNNRVKKIELGPFSSQVVIRKL